MYLIVGLIMPMLLGVCIICYRKKRESLRLKNTLIDRFRKKINTKYHNIERIKTSFSEKLMAEPNRNINISLWDKENILREKADIHRARLAKYGHSRLNGELFLKDSEGGVYKYDKNGKKKYV